VAGEWIVNVKSDVEPEYDTRSDGSRILLNDGAVHRRARTSVDRDVLDRLGASALSLSSLRYLGVNHSFAFRTDVDTTYEQLVPIFNTLNGFVSVTPSIVRFANATPSDPAFGQQWHLNNTGQSTPSRSNDFPYNIIGNVAGTVDADIDASEAWDITPGDSSSVVAIIGTGVNYDHVDLSAGFIGGTDILNNDPYPMDDDGHETNAAGVILASGNNSTGVTGVSWHSKYLAVKTASATQGTSIPNFAAAVDWVIAQKNSGINVRVINYSYGGPGFIQDEYDAIQRVQDTTPSIIHLTAFEVTPRSGHVAPRRTV
jgi:subtilisin family serine protease